MARQRLCERKVKALRAQTGLPIVAVLIRGNTRHRRDLWLEDGTITYMWPDGTLEPTDSIHGMRRLGPPRDGALATREAVLEAQVKQYELEMALLAQRNANLEGLLRRLAHNIQQSADDIMFIVGDQTAEAK